MAADEALRVEGIPALDLWGKILGRVPKITLYEDNQATTRIITTGKYPKLRHVQRLHGVNIAWLHDLLKKELYDVYDTHTKRQAGDIFTKHFTAVPAWQHAVSLIGVVTDPKLSAALKKGITYPSVQKLNGSGRAKRGTTDPSNRKSKGSHGDPTPGSPGSSGFNRKAHGTKGKPMRVQTCSVALLATHGNS